MMQFDFSGRRALVTGSTQGIGYAIARCFAEHGAEVFVHCSRDTEKAQRIADEIHRLTGAVTHGIAVDLSEANAAEQLHTATGALDILVCNASVQFRRSWDEIPPDEYETQMNVNFRSALGLMQMYIPGMQKRGWGRVLNVGSVQQAKPHAQMAVYAASKCALASLTENIAKQVAADGVNVNMLVPGVIETPRNDAALSDPDYRKKVLAGIPSGYAGKPEDCAAAALLLCSDEGRYITGSSLYVDGGMRL